MTFRVSTASRKQLVFMPSLDMKTCSMQLRFVDIIHIHNQCQHHHFCISSSQCFMGTLAELPFDVQLHTFQNPLMRMHTHQRDRASYRISCRLPYARDIWPADSPLYRYAISKTDRSAGRNAASLSWQPGSWESSGGFNGSLGAPAACLYMQHIPELLFQSFTHSNSNQEPFAVTNCCIAPHTTCEILTVVMQFNCSSQ